YAWGKGAHWYPSGPGVQTSVEPGAANARAPAARAEPGGGAERPNDVELPAAPPPTDIVAAPAPAPSTDSGPAEPVRVTVAWSPLKDSRPVVTDIPNRRAGDDQGSRPAAGMLDGVRITCDWGAGNVTGARVGDSLTVFPGSQWQGSLMVYDLLGAPAGKARLTGTPGAVGSPTGEAEVEIRTVGSRVHFLGFLPNGTYMVTTIYDELDNMDRHVAVMSRHENATFNYGTQQLGVCY
ncbi:MAG TPA: hypothetical protein VFJ95_05815, partial [Gammaproteobacteria bacterium]|nr:hypothetical protein [Gammaproteobacteria bacterium]